MINITNFVVLILAHQVFIRDVTQFTKKTLGEKFYCYAAVTRWLPSRKNIIERLVRDVD